VKQIEPGETFFEQAVQIIGHAPNCSDNKELAGYQSCAFGDLARHDDVVGLASLDTASAAREIPCRPHPLPRKQRVY
jgi:hypothetical protein